MDASLYRLQGSNRHLDVQPEVQAALAAGGPVVALETTLVAHGMPYPANLTTARRLEAIVRAEGAVPATIGLLGGRIKIGLTDAELERFARGGVPKVSRRDLAHTVASGGDGATTVASTMACAAMAGIRVMATGGIGGVHRGGERSLDVSADLQELARTPVAVVCAGAKSILDLPRTLEVLETLGVPVLGFRCDELPAFYCRRSGLPVNARLESEEEVARLLAVKWELGLEGGVVLGVPVPEEHALDPAEVEACIADGLARAEAGRISGKAATPFLLACLRELTSGRSLAANIALVEQNCGVGARVAVALARIS